jgi:dGTPase
MGSGNWLAAPWDERRSGTNAARVNDWRSWHERDRGRIIHSGAFRRLQTKTQVLGMGGSDFHRTRLTHSMETAQIAQGIAARLAAEAATPEAARSVLPPPSLIEAVALAHDLGHPPFGHGGETALNWCMRHDGGFEGNGQTLRVVTRLEAHTDHFGLDLARRTLLGVLKYPRPYSQYDPPAADTIGAPMRAADWKPNKCYYDIDALIVDWILAPFGDQDRLLMALPPRDGLDYRSLDTGILELADDIAYGVHDLEDAIALRLVTLPQVLDVWHGTKAAMAGLSGAPVESTIADLFADESARKRAIGFLVNFFIIHIGLCWQEAPASPVLAWQVSLRPEAATLLNAFISLIRREVISAPVVQMLEYRGQEIVRRLFETVAADPSRFLPMPWLVRWREHAGSQGSQRVICDYIATMTDEQATRNYELFFSPRGGLTFGVL